ncbi:MAG: hypothetical protein RXO31_04775, partial [Acidianus sp.]
IFDLTFSIVKTSKPLIVPSITASSGIMLLLVPECIEVIERVNPSNGLTILEVNPCKRLTICAEIKIGSKVE